VLDLWTNELDAMRRHGCLFMLTNHPFLSGRPGRVETLRALIEHALSRGDVEFATAGQVAARVRADPHATKRTLRPVEVDTAIYPDE
jgi:peptidoglycan-N-acetylglucosamine deacetylase